MRTTKFTLVNEFMSYFNVGYLHYIQFGLYLGFKQLHLIFGGFTLFMSIYKID